MKLPHFYRPYFLEDLVQEINDEGWTNQLWLRDLPKSINDIRFAKVLFYVGEFQQAINKLFEAGHYIEGTIVGLAMTELSLIVSK